MKRAGNLWPEVTSWQNLLEAALAAAQGKHKRPGVARFRRIWSPTYAACKALKTHVFPPSEIGCQAFA